MGAFACGDWSDDRVDFSRTRTTTTRRWWPVLARQRTLTTPSDHLRHQQLLEEVVPIAGDDQRLSPSVVLLLIELRISVSEITLRIW